MAIMEGHTVSHYRIVEKLDDGGMGVVYKARDERLQRTVALKFLTPALTRDERARRRFVQEAQTASALDHPNICTIYEIDTTPDGQMFLAMAYYEGETLKTRIQRGPLNSAEAVDVAMHVARGLAKAHAAGIVHRDIKPANVMVTSDGAIKILDFGIAKLLGETGLTKTGLTPGTVAYMSPEQVNGQAVDQRTDLWALGVVLYQMVTGQLPFRGDAAVHAILHDQPAKVRTLRRDVPVALEKTISRALEKDVAARYATAADLLEDLADSQADFSLQHRPARTQGIGSLLRQPRAALLLTLMVAVIVALVVWGRTRQSDDRWAREEAIPRIERYAEAGDWESAYALAKRVQSIIPKEGLDDLWSRFSWVVTIPSDPPGARVFRRAYSSSDGEWEELGTTPLENIRFPFGLSRLRFEAPGYQPLHRTLGSGILVGTHLQVANPFKLDTASSLPEGKIRVSGWSAVIAGDPVAFHDFALNRYEVTNRDYKRFVDAGGYKRHEFWEHAFVSDGRTLSWEEAMALFTDKTGRPGPSTWEAGDYRDGRDDYPVAGVSWYEAAAYARFVGEELPTVHHWRRAFSPESSAWLLPASNLERDELAAVGQFHGMSWPGTFDMAGNVREWCFNAIGDQRFILGGGWNDQYYVAQNMNYAQPPMNRSSSNGFRLVITYDGEQERARARAPAPAAASAPIWLRVPASFERVIAPKTISDELFAAYQNMYAYDRAPLNASSGPTVSTRHWTRERISFDAGYGGERMILYLFLPRNGSPPYQTVVYWPGSAAMSFNSIDQYQIHLDFVLKSGRAVAFPVFKSTFERGDRAPLPVSSSAAFRDLFIQWVKDLRRSVDYLETRPDLVRERIAFYGHSWGGANAPTALAMERRFRTAVLYVAGLYDAPFQPEIDPLTFLSHVDVPVLMLNGELDNAFPLETNARRFFQFLGTPGRSKKLVVAPGGHFVPSPVLIRETLDWLDKYLGPP
jgi:eukaryotic-like serine/threonine-protein kinase